MSPWELAKSGSEHGEQRALMAWANMACRCGFLTASRPEAYKQTNTLISAGDVPVPQLRWLHAIHNQGHGDAIRGSHAKAEGVKAGVADVFLPVSITRFVGQGDLAISYCGLYVEMKKLKGGVLSDKQKDFAEFVQAQGYRWCRANGWQEAAAKMQAYLTDNWQEAWNYVPAV